VRVRVRVRVREDPITLDKILGGLPQLV